MPGLGMLNGSRILSGRCEPLLYQFSEQVRGPQRVVTTRYEDDFRLSFLDRNRRSGHIVRTNLQAPFVETPIRDQSVAPLQGPFTHTTDEGLIAATTLTRGSSAAINRAASAPFESPT